MIHKTMSLTENDLITIVKAVIAQKGHAGHHIESMNYFVGRGIPQIVKDFYKWDEMIENRRDTMPEDKDIESFHLLVTYPNVYVKTTKIIANGTEMDITPANARNTDRTYGVTLFADIHITVTPNMRVGSKTKLKPIDVTISAQKISVIPIAVRGDYCVLSGYSQEALIAAGEDPKDPGGYVIINGKEWVINCLENSWVNALSIYKNTKYEDELVRGTIIAKNGDAFEHTYQNRFYFRENNKLDYSLTIGKGTEIRLPFYALFRILGISDDRLITEMILGDDISSRSSQTSLLRTIVEDAFAANYGPVYNRFRNIFAADKIGLEVAILSNPDIRETEVRDDEEKAKFYISRILKHFDDKVLQQYGTSINDRHMKACIAGKYIRDIILAHYDIIPTSDRDSFQVKRIHAAGITLSKAFKMNFNKVIHTKIKRAIMNTLYETEFSKADLMTSVRSMINREGPKLETAISGSISRGDETFNVKGQEVINRVSSQTLQHKNDFNVISALNVVTAAGSGAKAAKATERADMMRRNHASSIGYICPNYSADTGEPVGINKSLASTSEITLSSSSAVLENYLRRNKEMPIIAYESIPVTSSREYCLVSVNGKYIGYCRDQMTYADYFRDARRRGEIHFHTSIVTEATTAEVIFWTDYGRMIRPLIIVYSNINDIRDACLAGKTPPAFKQYHKLTTAHIADLQCGLITLKDLVDGGIVEYIAAPEQFNCLLTTLDDFDRATGDVTRQYTHIDIAQAIPGIIALASPLANHSSCVRITYSTNHVKQACNRYHASWGYRFDNNSYFGWCSESPIVSTISNDYGYSTAQNMYIAVAMHAARNQEDSGDVNRAAIERGVFNGIYLKTETIYVQEGFTKGIPDTLKTTGIDKKAYYGDLNKDGVIRVGSVVKKDTVLVSMYQRLETAVDGCVFVDRSNTFNNDEEWRVHNVIEEKSANNGLPFVRILMYTTRHLGVGSKTSSRMGNKSIISTVTNPSDMPYTLQGMQPQMIVNPHSFPSRMAISQCLEGTLATYAAYFGCFVNATSFQVIDFDHVFKALKEIPGYGADGLDYGYHYMYNGETGEMMPYKIFMCPQVYQRLGKFVENAQYAVAQGPVYANTRQPLQGKRQKGGLRLGEMEQAVFCGQGTATFMEEKFRADSDGRDTYICKGCGYRAIVNEQNGLYLCLSCADKADIRRVPGTYTTNQVFHMLDAANIDVKFILNE
jgi:DNA-directed RNA polymerase beta subunit